MRQPLRQHMALLEQAIAAAFVNDGLPVHLLQGTQGPHTLTFALRLYQPTKANLAKALKLAGAVEAAIGDSPVRIYSESGIIFVEAPSPAPVLLYGRQLHGAGLAVPLGMTARRAIAGLDFEASPHVLLVGPTNAGKTTAARAIAYHLARQNRHATCRFIVATFKPKDWKAFAGLAHTFAVIVTPAETAQALTWLKTVMYSRTAQEIDTPQLFFFLDDLLNLLGAAAGDPYRASIAGDLRELASLGRAAGIHLIIGTQRLGESGAGGAAITGNIRTRLVFGTADAGDAAQFTGRGESGAEKLGRYKGDALLVTEGRTQRLAVAYVADGDLAALRQSADDWRPWLNGPSHWPRDRAGTATAPAMGRPNPVTPASPTPTAYYPPIPPDAAAGHFAARPPRQARGPDWEPGRETGQEPEPQPGPESGWPPAPEPERQPGPEPVEGHRLANQPPSAPEQQLLRKWFAQLGSKRAVLKIAWGNVVNADGNTPKTRRWLAEALNAGEIHEEGLDEEEPCGKP